MTPMKMIGSQVSAQPFRLPRKPLTPPSSAVSISGSGFFVRLLDDAALRVRHVDVVGARVRLEAQRVVALVAGGVSSASWIPVVPWLQPVAGGTQKVSA